MKTKQQFVDEYADRLAGMLLMLFAKSENTHMDVAQRGRWMQMEVDRVRPLLREMYGFINEEIGQVVEPHIGQYIDAVIRHHKNGTPEVKKKIVEQLRSAFGSPEKKP